MGFFGKLGSLLDLLISGAGQRIKSLFKGRKSVFKKLDELEQRVKKLEQENKQLKAENQELKQEVQQLKEILKQAKPLPKEKEFQQLEIYFQGTRDKKQKSLDIGFLLINSDEDTIQAVNHNIPISKAKELTGAEKFIRTAKWGLAESNIKEHFVEIGTIDGFHDKVSFSSGEELKQYLGV